MEYCPHYYIWRKGINVIPEKYEEPAPEPDALRTPGKLPDYGIEACHAVNDLSEWMKEFGAGQDERETTRTADEEDEFNDI